jgi:kinesin family protein 18/19
MFGCLVIPGICSRLHFGEWDVPKDAVESQAEMVVNLVGIVGRHTVMIGEAGRLLRSSVEEGRDGMESTVRAMTASLKNVTEKNEAFTTMIGHSTVGHMRDERSALAIDVFKGHPTSFMWISSTPRLQPPKPRSSRRSLSYGGPGSPCRTPRKSLRSSISQPYRRVSDKEKDKKSVQWREMRLVQVIWMMVDSSSSYFLLRRRLWHVHV